MFYKAFTVLIEASPPELMGTIRRETKLFGRVGSGTFNLNRMTILRGFIERNSASGWLEGFLGVRKGLLAGTSAVFA